MFRILFIVLVSLNLAAPVEAQDNAGAIQGVISSQIKAFQQDDFATAFTYASPMIQGLFGTSENFGMMVRNGYPMVWRPADVQFKDLKGTGGVYFQKVLVQDAQGVYYMLEYQMIQTRQGWQINGVTLLEQPPVGA